MDANSAGANDAGADDDVGADDVGADDAESGDSGDGPLVLNDELWPIEFGAYSIAAHDDGVVGALDVDGVTHLFGVSPTAVTTELAAFSTWSQGRVTPAAGSGMALDVHRLLDDPAKCAYVNSEFELDWEYSLTPNQHFLGAADDQALTMRYEEDSESGEFNGPFIEAISTATTPPSTLWSLDQSPPAISGGLGIRFLVHGALMGSSGWFVYGSYAQDFYFAEPRRFDLRHFDVQGQLAWRYHIDDPRYTYLPGVVSSATGVVACGNAAARTPGDDPPEPTWAFCVGVSSDGVEEWRTEHPLSTTVFAVQFVDVVSPNDTDAIVVMNLGGPTLETIAIRMGPDGVAWQQELPVDGRVLGVAYSGGALWISTVEHLYRFVDSGDGATP